MSSEKVTGLGGVFIKSDDVPALTAWYDRHLGTTFGDQTYMGFEWREKNSDKEGTTAFSIFKKDTKYFASENQPCMLNFRVNNLEKLIEELRAAGVTIAGEVQSYSYGKFGWILDPEGNKIELWEDVAEGEGK